MTTYGPTFGEELHAAGLSGLPISWDSENLYWRENLTPQQQTELAAVEAAHDPTKQLPPQAQPETTLLYDHENRLRTLEGQPPITLQDVVNKMKGA